MRFGQMIGLLLTVLLSSAALAAERKPNIVVFLADDHGVLDSEVYGAKDMRTPNMARLAKEGMTFTRAFVASPSCAPSRAALLTGLMPARNGAEVNHAKPRPEIKKLPAYFQELGYEVAAFGKVSHYKHTADYGFDYFAHDTFHDPEAVTSALRWLNERRSEKPLCLFVGSNWPHVPWPQEPREGEVKLPAKMIDTEETRLAREYYAAAVGRMDDELGQVYDLAREKLGKDTLFIHTSDHGAQFPFGKWNCYDSGIRTSFLAVWPGEIKAGARSQAMISWVDILPTLIEAAGGQPPKSVDGKSFLAVLKGERTEHRDEIFTTHTADGKMNIYPMRSLRTSEWKYIRNLHPEFKYTTHIDRAKGNERSKGNWGGHWLSWIAAAERNREAAKIVRQYHQRPAEELYYLPEDSHEEKNLAGDPNHSEKLKTMRGRLTEWMREQGDEGKVYGEGIPLGKGSN